MNKYFNKYLKYKKKYINLQKKNVKLLGGSDNTKTSSTPINLDKPIFLITFGPTGSGKSLLLDKTLSYLEISYKLPSFKKSLIDDLIENNIIYKHIFNNIILNQLQQIDSKYFNNIKFKEDLDHLLNNKDIAGSLNNYQSFFNEYLDYNNITEIGKKLDNPSGGLSYDIDRAYKYTRSYGCGKIPLLSYGDCNIKNDIDLSQYIKKKENIVFETTGENSLDWLFNEFITPNYQIIISCSYVNHCELKKRNKSRASSQFNNYIKDITNVSAPRLPDMKTDIFNNKMIAIKNNLKELISKKSYRILIFNNNNQGGPYADALFDSNISVGNYNIDDIFETSSDCDTTSDTTAVAADVVTADDIEMIFE